MEVTVHMRDEAWGLLYRAAGSVLEAWLTGEELGRLREIIDEPLTGEDFVQLRERLGTLSEEHLTEAQRRFIERPGADPKRHQAFPWPAPEPVAQSSIDALVREMMKGSSAQSRAAGELVVIAASIEMADRTDGPDSHRR